jgi:hypothetical protein
LGRPWLSWPAKGPCAAGTRHARLCDRITVEVSVHATRYHHRHTSTQSAGTKLLTSLRKWTWQSWLPGTWP